MTAPMIFTPEGNTTASFWSDIGVPQRGKALYDLLYLGFPMVIFDRLSEVAGLEKAELANVICISLATLSRRRKTGRFSTDESDRLYRLAQVLHAAIALFEGDEQQATYWIKTPVRGLNNKAPIDMLRTHAETEAVLTLIARLEHSSLS